MPSVINLNANAVLWFDSVNQLHLSLHRVLYAAEN